VGGNPFPINWYLKSPIELELNVIEQFYSTFTRVGVYLKVIFVYPYFGITISFGITSKF